MTSTFPLKWGKNEYELTVDATTTTTSLMQQVEQLTGVPVKNQKITAKRGWKGILSIDTKLKFKVGKTTLSLMGSDTETITAATEAASNSSSSARNNQQQLFEEDVRTAVRRSAEHRLHLQKERHKKEDVESKRIKNFVEICSEEEEQAIQRKESMILTGKWRVMAAKLHNEKQTRYAQWTCLECTVENYASEKTCHVCLHARVPIHKGRSSGSYYRNTSTISLPPILSVFGLEGFSGTVEVAAIRATMGGRHSLRDRYSLFEHLPSMLEGSTLLSSRGPVSNGDVECAFSCSTTSRTVVAVHPSAVLRGLPEWINDEFEKYFDDLILTDDGEHFGIFIGKKIMHRGDVFECTAMRSLEDTKSLCMWFVVELRE